MNYLSPKVTVGHSPTAGHGLFAIMPIAQGEVILDLGIGSQTFVTKQEAQRRYKEEGFDYMIQVDDDRFIVTVTDETTLPQGYVNHSCEPNCGIKDALQIVAMRDIAPGEEITFDYAMSESSEYEMACGCSAPRCRKRITGDDWQISELRERYGGYFSPYLQKKIEF